MWGVEGQGKPGKCCGWRGRENQVNVVDGGQGKPGKCYGWRGRENQVNVVDGGSGKTR